MREWDKKIYEQSIFLFDNDVNSTAYFEIRKLLKTLEEIVQAENKFELDSMSKSAVAHNRLVEKTKMADRIMCLLREMKYISPLEFAMYLVKEGGSECSVPSDGLSESFKTKAHPKALKRLRKLYLNPRRI